MASSPVSPSPVATAAALELFEEAAFRRLLKARHHDLNKMEIRTKVLFATLYSEAMRFTVYKFKIRSKARPTAPGSEWTIAKRYSEFFLFRQQMLKRIEAWEATLDSDKKLQSKEFALIANSLRGPLATRDFPRKHMRCDTDQIIDERRTKLQEFVCSMLDAYADLSVLMAKRPSKSDDTIATAVRDMFVHLEEFLDIPKSQKEIDRRQTAAVLALEDVEFTPTHKHSVKERTCCICLDDIDEEGDDSETVSSACSENTKLVKLPCQHQFHEDCVIDWFNTSTTCPLCRQAPFTEDALSFDVSVNM